VRFLRFGVRFICTARTNKGEERLRKKDSGLLDVTGGAFKLPYLVSW